MTVNTGKVAGRRQVYYATFDELLADAERMSGPAVRTLERMNRESRRAPSPIFGTLSREDADRLHLTHSAMHMSFLVSDKA